jgi:hypothetical protein
MNQERESASVTLRTIEQIKREENCGGIAAIHIQAREARRIIRAAKKKAQPLPEPPRE